MTLIEKVDDLDKLLYLSRQIIDLDYLIERWKIAAMKVEKNDWTVESIVNEVEVKFKHQQELIKELKQYRIDFIEKYLVTKNN